MSYNAANNVFSEHSRYTLPRFFPHGGGIEAAARQWNCAIEDIVDLSTGLHPAGAPAWLPAWMAKHAGLVAHYPDAAGEPARSVLADAFSVKPQQVLIVAGAQAVIEVVFQAFQWRTLALRIPCYHEPIRCARRAACRIIPYLPGELPGEAEACWLISPSNPLGDQQLFPQDRGGLWDESYMPFKERCELGLIPGVLRLGSLTKLFCIPGLRLGYVVAETSMIHQLREWLPPWPAPTQAIHLLPALLCDVQQREHSLQQARQQLLSLLQSYGWHTQASHASFVLATPPECGMADPATHRLLLRNFPEWPQLGAAIRFGLPGTNSAWQRLEAFLADGLGQSGQPPRALMVEAE